MRTITSLKLEFVEFMPSELAEGVLYVSMVYSTAIHKCCCGCGQKVVTPFSPTDWQLTFDGEAVSLKPSIGNWNFPCQSHYWVERNRVRWAPRWTSQQIEAGRAGERDAKDRHFGVGAPTGAPPEPIAQRSRGETVFSRFWAWLSRHL